MADNSPTSGGAGDTIATDDLATLNGGASSGVKVQRVKVGFGDDSDFRDASTAYPLPISVNAANFIFSTVNSSTAQLGPGAAFVGTVEDLRSHPAISILLRADQPGILRVMQYTDAAGLVLDQTWSINTYASPDQQVAISRTVNANYLNVFWQNTGGVPTTTLNLNTAYGTIPAATSLGNAPMSLEEVGGKSFSLGATTAAKSIPVALATDQQAYPGIKTSDDTVATLIAPTANDADARSLADILDPLGPNFVPLQVAVAGVETTGQQTAARSIPVVLASDQPGPSPIVVSGTFLAGAANGSQLSIMDLKTASSVSIVGYGTTTSSWAFAVEVQHAVGGAWEVAKGWYSLTTSSITRPVIPIIGSFNLGGINTNFQVIIDTTDALSIRIRSTNSGTSTAMNVTILAKQVTNNRYIGVDLTSIAGLTLASGGNSATISAVPVGGGAASGSGLGNIYPIRIAGSDGTLNQNWGVVLPPSGLVAASIGVGLTGNGVSTLNSTEISSQTRTTTGNSSAIADSLGGAIGATIVVTSVSGTTPTLDLVLQECSDNGATWVDVYHCERLTVAGTLIVPNIPLNGRRRWSWTVGGTTPSFTFPVATTRGGGHPFPRFVQFFDRTANVLSGTAAAVTAAYQVAGCMSVTATVTIGAATTGGMYKLQGSTDNGQNWFDASAVLNAVANSTVSVASTAGMVFRHARIICSTAATAQTGTVVSITGTGL